ncbi:non-ribosomal peptide synthetase [Streptomyces sp. NPDC002262]|uniref:non-ribosomal peptide synthetase n=1 Tax=Streptomyces sp. NPDC002262 TaxID=3154414 RepID=UPI003328FFAA
MTAPDLTATAPDAGPLPAPDAAGPAPDAAGPAPDAGPLPAPDAAPAPDSALAPTPRTVPRPPGVAWPERRAGGNGVIEAEALAAFLAVLHRFTAQETVTLTCRNAAGDPTEVTADFATAPAFGDLLTLVAAESGTDGVRGDGEGPVEAEFTGARDGYLLVRDPAGAAPSGRAYRVSAAGGTDPALADALADALRAAADDGARNPDRPVPLLRLTDDEERDRTRGTAAPPARCVHELVGLQAARTPDAVAVGQGDDTLTYRALDARADALAAVLRSRGIGEGDVVPVLQRRSPSLVVTLLAVMKAGAAYLALDAQDAPGRTTRLISESGARLVLADRHAPDLVPDGVHVLDPDDPRHPDGPPGHRGTARTTDTTQHPDTLAYVSFTSGTTGEPRGVGVPHRAVSRLVRAPNWIDIRPDDVFLLLAPVAFDASTLELWAPLVHGCRLAIAPDGVLEIDHLAQVLKEEAVSVLWLTAGLFHQMAVHRPDAFGGVRHLVAGGDTVSPGHLERLLRAHPGIVFTNGYGPTENTTFTTCWTTTTAPPDGATVPIGHPVTGTRVAVLDTGLRPVPAGCWGELYASGDGLARGYVNSATATARHFLPDVFSGVPGARMYRTGDLARRLPDGTLEFLGRADHQLKIQGFRVEPHQVESELSRTAGVRDAVVVAQPDGAGGKRLLAYVAVEDAAAADLGVRLRENLREVLPPYAVPWAIVVVDRLPLNANGKVDRRALPVATRVPRNVGDPFVEPRDAEERGLAALWGEVLGVEPIGVEDDFFDLGGHSLLAAELLGTLKERFGVDVPARVLYLQPTIAELAEHLRNQGPIRRP